MRNYFLLSILFVFLSASLYAVLIKPWYVSARVKYDHIESLRKVFAQGEDLQAMRDMLQSQINTIPEDKRKLVEDAIPKHSPENIALFLLALDNLVYAESGLPLDVAYAVGGERVSSDTDTVILPVTFNFSAIQYRSLRDFITNIQSWGRGVRIQSLQIGAPTDSSAAERGFVRATIVVEALFIPDSGTL